MNDMANTIDDFGADYDWRDFQGIAHRRKDAPMSDTTWTPEQMRERADEIITDPCECSAASVSSCTWCAQTAAMLRQGAADRERVTTLEAEVLALRTLLTSYNVGGWTDALAPMQRALEAEAQLAAVTAERDALKAAVWQPIAAAPKDGTPILVYTPSAEGLPALICRAAWHPSAGFCVCEFREPTHWMPLPAPPEGVSDDPR